MVQLLIVHFWHFNFLSGGTVLHYGVNHISATHLSPSITSPFFANVEMILERSGCDESNIVLVEGLFFSYLHVSGFHVSGCKKLQGIKNEVNCKSEQNNPK